MTGLEYRLSVVKLACAARAGLAAAVMGPALLFTAAGAQAQSCTGGAIPCFQPLGFLPNASTPGSAAVAISADGTVVVGNATNATGQTEAFRWANGIMTGLGKLPDSNGQTGVCTAYTCSFANGVSGDGSIVVGYGYMTPGDNQGDPAQRAFIWSGGTMSQLAPACSPRNTADGSNAYAISADGSTIVGGFGCYSTGVSQAFRYSGGTMTALPSLSGSSYPAARAVSANGSVIVGLTGYMGQAFRWTASGGTVGLGFLPGQSSSAAYAVSGDGSATFGLSHDANGDVFRWVNGAMSDLGGGGCYFCGTNSVLGANSNGAVLVGGARWTARTGWQLLDALLQAHGINLQGMHDIAALSVSADGQTFAGYGYDPDGNQQAFIARLPLPPANAHDFNGDGTSDILWRDTSGDVALWLMNGAAVASSAVVANVANAWSIVGQRDFDGDGKADILWRDTSGNVAIWFMNGAAVSSVASFGSVGGSWAVAGTGDFNGDGKGDIIWLDTSGNVALWLMNGASVSSAALLGSVGPNWFVVGTGDFDGDGKADILWRDTSGDMAIWFMNGTSVASVASLGTVGGSWAVAGTGDFNGDGNADILWRDNGGNLAIWLLNSNGVVASNKSLGTVSGWSVAQTGDYNGDGMSDVLWTDANGDVAVWFMNNAAVSSAAVIATVPPAWTIQGAAAD